MKFHSNLFCGENMVKICEILHSFRFLSLKHIFEIFFNFGKKFAKYDRKFSHFFRDSFRLLETLDSNVITLFVHLLVQTDLV